MAEHAKLSPSSAHRWMHCPGSVSLEAALDGAVEYSEAAAEGTVFHSLIEDCLRLGLEPKDFLDEVRVVDGHTIKIDLSMVQHAQDGLDYLSALPEAELFMEQRISLDRWLPGQFGTLDIGLIGEGWIGVWDWKYGRGIPVSPENNEQLMLYALGFWDTVARHKTDAMEINLFIFQPRIKGAGGCWVVPLEELLSFGEKVEKAGKATQAKSPKFFASEEVCRFCDAKSICDEYQRHNLALIGLVFEDLDSPELELSEPQSMTLSRCATVVKNTSNINTWLDVVYARVLGEALAGEETPGVKLVHGRKGNRYWTDEEVVSGLIEKELGADAYIKKLISPTEAEKRLSSDVWGGVRAWIDQAEAKPILVDEKDKRSAITPPNVVDVFEKL